jgi:hypothetical protein
MPLEDPVTTKVDTRRGYVGVDSAGRHPQHYIWSTTRFLTEARVMPSSRASM